LHNEKLQTINDLEREAFKQKLMSVSLNDYFKKKISSKNMMYSIEILLISLLVMITFWSVLFVYCNDYEFHDFESINVSLKGVVTNVYLFLSKVWTVFEHNDSK